MLSPIRDDNAAHQIRIEYTQQKALCVSCTCIQRVTPGGYLQTIIDANEALAAWKRHWAASLATVNQVIHLPRIS